MPLTRLKTSNFPAGSGVVNAEVDIDVSWEELVWAAISVGKGSLAHMVQHGTYSTFEMTYRIAMIYANLLEMPNGYFGRSSAYIGLDPSDKGAISYFMGLTLTKAFAARKLKIPWLMHVDVYRHQFGVALMPTGGRRRNRVRDKFASTFARHSGVSDDANHRLRRPERETIAPGWIFPPPMACRTAAGKRRRVAPRTPRFAE